MIHKDALPDDFWDAALVQDFAHRVAPMLAGVYRDGGEEAIDEFNLGLSFDFLEPNSLAYGQDRGAEMIGRKLVEGKWVDNPNAKWVIDETTREESRKLLAEAMKGGWSGDDFAGRLEESGLFGESRAAMIARTESAIAMNRGKAASFREAEIEEVYVYDGDYDPECEAANGEIWSLEEFEANPIEHPNCERDARPLTRSEREEKAA